MPATLRFQAEILAAGGGGHAVIVPAEVAGAFPTKRIAVRALVNGHEYRSRLMVYGGKSYLGLRRDLLRAIAAAAGDEVTIELSEDTEPTPEPAPVTEPAELVAALDADPVARAAYDAMPPSHRREYARWIGEAKRADTRQARVAKTIRRLTDPD